MNTTESYDIIIVGLGANGSSALYHLSRAGKKILGIDRFQQLAWHHGGRPIAPDQLSNDVTDQEIAEIKTLAAAHLAIDPVFKRSAVCMYTNTPDDDFIIDHHPDHPNIIIASPCSGHGFKFSSLTGKLLADLAIKGHTEFDLSHSPSTARP